MENFISPVTESDEWREPTWDVALLFPDQGTWSVEEYLQLETNRLVEFSHGKVEVLPVPSDKHQTIVLYLVGILLAYAQRTGGKALTAPFRLQLWPGKLREPDLVFLASADDERRQDSLWHGADLVIEVVSPDDPRRDLVTKRFEYARAGIPEYWIVDPRTEMITVLHLAGDSTERAYAEHGRFQRGGLADSPNFDDLSVDVAAVFDAP